MWSNGSITADATVVWEDCADPISITKFVASSRAAESPLSGMSAVGMALLGGVIGLLISYLLRPTIFGRSPTFVEWFTEGFSSPFASNIITCGLIGLVVGFVIGYLLDSSANRQ
jgi:uncharacterized protein YacL